MEGGPRRPVIVALWLLAAALAVRLTVVSVLAAAVPAHGFVAHYAASRLILEGVNAARLYDDSVVVAAVQRFEPGITDIFGANPPTVAAAALPLALLEYRTARLVWTLIALGLWLGASIWLTRVTRLRGAWTPALLCVAFVFEPVFENLRHAQFHTLVLVLVLIAWRAVTNARAAVAGAGLTAALVLKAAGLFLWPLLIAWRQWRTLAWAAGIAVGSALVFFPFGGLAAWAAFTDRARDLAAGGSLSVTAYQSLPGLVRRLTTLEARWNPRPFLDLGAGGEIVALLLVAVVLAAGLVVAVKRRGDLVFAAFSALSLALSPVSLEYHYLLAIFPIAVVLGRQQSAMAGLPGLLLVAATLSIAVKLPYRSPALADGALALLAYPRLYGALLLAGLCLTAAWKDGAAAHPGAPRARGRDEPYLTGRP